MKNKELISEYVKILAEKEKDNPYDVLQALQKRNPGAPASPKTPLRTPLQVPKKYYPPIPTTGSPASPAVPTPLKAKSLPIAKQSPPVSLPKLQEPTMSAPLGGMVTQTKGTGKLSLPQKDIDKMIKNLDPNDLPDATKHAKLIKPPSLQVPNATKYATLLDPDQEKLPNATRYAKLMQPGQSEEDDLPDATKHAKLIDPNKQKTSKTKKPMPSLSKLSKVSYV